LEETRFATIHGATKQANQIEKGLPPHSSEIKK
jgi:hypothetical protein